MDSYINSLIDEITEYMLSCGGPYTEKYILPLQEAIVWSLATGQYIWVPNKYYVCWWNVEEEDIETLEDGVQPLNTSYGPIIYIRELGLQNTSIREVISAIRKQNPHVEGACWFRYKKKKFMFYPSQKGKE